MRAIYACSSNRFYPEEGGVYISEDFTITGDQPTWRRVNNGLPSLDIFQMRVDPFNATERQYVLLKDYGVYRRYEPTYGDNWGLSLSKAQADILCGGPGLASYLMWLATSETTPGRLLVAYWRLGGTNWVHNSAYIIVSEDYGSSWTAYCIPTSRWCDEEGNSVDIRAYYHGAWSVEERNDNVFISLNSKLSGCVTVMIKGFPPEPTPGCDCEDEGCESDCCCSDLEDICSCYDVNPLATPEGGFSGWGTAPIPDRTDTPDWDGVCYAFMSSSCAIAGPTDLYRINKFGDAVPDPIFCAYQVLQDGEDLGLNTYVSIYTRNDVVWISPSDPNNGRIIGKNNRLYICTDHFEVSAANDLVGFLSGTNPCNLVSPEGNEVPVCFSRGQGAASEVTAVGMIYSLSNEYDNSPENRSGTNYNVAPFTDAIPGVVGLSAYNGLWVGDAPTRKGIYTYAVELGDVGVEEGIPMHGDRGVWEIIDFPYEHARDINDGTYEYHHGPGSGSSHFPVTLTSFSDEFLDIAAGTQILDSDVQNPNTFLAGPESGSVADHPTFRDIVQADLGSGTPDGTKFLRDDLTWQPASGFDPDKILTAAGEVLVDVDGNVIVEP